MNQHELIKLANFKMPFGKYKDRYLVYIPEEYIIWLINNHSLNNNLKSKFLLMKEIKDNGLEYLILPLISKV